MGLKTISKITIVTITVHNSCVSPVSCIRSLGVMYDCTLSMQEHVNKRCRKSMAQLRGIHQICRCLTTDATKSLQHAFVMYCVDYGDALLVGAPKKQIAQLQLVQIIAIHILYNLRKYYHIYTCLAQEHYLSS